MLYNPFTNTNLRDDSKKSVQEALSGHYNVRRVREGSKSGLFGSTYYVDLKDGGTMKVKVDKKTGLFGGERTFIKSIID